MFFFCPCTKETAAVANVGAGKHPLKCSPICHNYHGNRLNGKLEDEDGDDEELELPPTLVEELDENMKENIEDEDEEYKPQPGSFRP
ncbi:hypothetical protein PR048_010116 [Dryococelus australis]|uniref:Uncharacterized protein n=1 Tax=Dryococelus australis TaxID=614101 RepID=A0ABQ9I1X4_9NEOP|nr:hypothetical protein PR048_010116 [Dryococelus australis]